MANPQISKEFSDFGIKMKLLAYLEIFAFIFFAIPYVLRFIILLYVIMLIVGLIFQIIVQIILYFALENIKETGYALNNESLREFRTKMIVVLILRIIGYLIIVSAYSTMILLFEMGVLLGTGWTFVLLFVFIIINGVILLLIASILGIIAWGGLNNFFLYEMNVSPIDIHNNAKSGANLCKIGAILDCTFIFWFIGYILRIIGYFKLGSLKNMDDYAPPQPIYQPTGSLSIPKSDSSMLSANYCSNCGISLISGARFCPNCGSKI
ncbi:MAG: zinc ribbon domain-containing protein [Promethearchaeota archaeon]